MPGPDVAELERMAAADGIAAIVAHLESAAAVQSTLMDVVRIEPRPDADFAGDIWFVCRLPDGTLDPIAPPYTSQQLEELLDAQGGEFAVAGWTRPELTCVLLVRGYAVRVTVPGEDYMPIARWNLEVLGQACAALATRRYPDVASMPDATGALRRRAGGDDGDGSDGDDEHWPPTSAGGLLGEGWEELDDELGPALGEDAATYYGAARLALADHFALRPVPPDVRGQRRREDAESGRQVPRGRFEIVDARSGDVRSVWREGLAFEQDLASALAHQWNTPYPMSQNDDLFAYKGHFIEVDYPRPDRLDDYDLSVFTDPDDLARFHRLARPIDTEYRIVRRIMDEFSDLEELNREATDALVARYLPPPYHDMIGEAVTDLVMRDTLTEAQYARFRLTLSEDEDRAEHLYEAAIGGELTLDEWRAFEAEREPQLPDRRRERIPERVRHEVWRRDEGRCVSCGSRERLEFDHIIPHSRGGSDTARNLQLLCEPCNRRKSATI